MCLISKSPCSLLLHKTGGFCFFSFPVTQVQNRNIITSDTYPFLLVKKYLRSTKAKVKESEVTQLCLTLCDPLDYNLPGSSIHGIFQARILEWVVILSPEDLPEPGIEPGSPSL